ncbi:hypothetical protein IAQ61_001858 [Plenodomus lingam]|uniref:uncharacterized protein n=1 Tax=Leptosphaeria maculans TaxID=5022 RepID=UPI00332EBD5F|nr:hypothetical protein IAQ61_001858 [Plenodomus lingam]
MDPPATANSTASVAPATPELTTPESPAVQESTQQTQTVQDATQQAPATQDSTLQVHPENEPPRPSSLRLTPHQRNRCHHQLTRDDRLRVKTLSEARHPRTFIASHLGISEYQVRYAIHAPLSPKKRTGRPRKMSQEQVEELLEFVRKNGPENKMTYPALARHFSHWNVSEHTIRHVMRRNKDKIRGCEL